MYIYILYIIYIYILLYELYVDTYSDVTDTCETEILDSDVTSPQLVHVKNYNRVP
jgi:hypothetical protein